MMSWMVESCKTRMWRAGMGGLAQPRAGSDTVLMVRPNFVAPARLSHLIWQRAKRFQKLGARVGIDDAGLLHPAAARREHAVTHEAEMVGAMRVG